MIFINNITPEICEIYQFLLLLNNIKVPFIIRNIKNIEKKRIMPL